MVCSQICGHPLLEDGICFPNVLYHICCHCPLLSTRSVPLPSGMICPTAHKDTFLWRFLGGVPMLQHTTQVLCLAPAHPSLASGPGTHKHHQGENQPPNPGKVIVETHKDCPSHL